MPLTRLANSVVEGDRPVDAVADDLAGYLNSDLLFYHAGHPEALVARVGALGSVLFWAADTLGAHFILAEGVVHAPARTAVAAARGALPTIPGRCGCMSSPLTGSALLARCPRRAGADQVWAAAHVDGIGMRKMGHDGGRLSSRSPAG